MTENGQYTPENWPYLLSSPAKHLENAAQFRRMIAVCAPDTRAVLLDTARLHIGLARLALRGKQND
jgi:hypothetical protein